MSLEIFQQEIREVKAIMLNLRPRIRFYEMAQKIEKLLPQYGQIIQKNLAQNQLEFIQFFEKNPQTILAFDIEELNNNAFCIAIIELAQDLKFEIKILGPIAFINEQESERIQSSFKTWLKTRRITRIISHGTNSKEKKIVNESGAQIINSQSYLSNAKNSHLKDQIKGESIGDFEKAIQFERQSCKFFKHNEVPRNTLARLVFQQFRLSLANHTNKVPQRICPLCKKPEDVLLYCLEDTFVSLFAYIWCKNRGIEGKNKTIKDENELFPKI